MKCCFCCNEIEKKYTPEGEMYWDRGNNPKPVSTDEDDRCCDTCNSNVVTPSRMNTLISRNKEVKSDD